MTESIVNSKKYYSCEALKSMGFSQYWISKLVEAGKLKKINKKMFENLNFSGDDHDFFYASAYVPNGVICRESAAVYYNLTTYNPDCIEVAIPRKAKVSTLPDWPDIRLRYFTDVRYEKGIETIDVEGNCFRIYDIEKTVCDIIFYREYVGIDETKEILVNYLYRKDRNLNKLIHYSKDLKCEKILRTYLEVLL